MWHSPNRWQIGRTENFILLLYLCLRNVHHHPLKVERLMYFLFHLPLLLRSSFLYISLVNDGKVHGFTEHWKEIIQCAFLKRVLANLNQFWKVTYPLSTCTGFQNVYLFWLFTKSSVSTWNRSSWSTSSRDFKME